MIIRTTINEAEKNKRTRQESHIERLGELGPPESPAAGHCVDGQNQREGFGLELGFLLTGRGSWLGGIPRSGGLSAGGNISYHSLRFEMIRW